MRLRDMLAAAVRPWFSLSVDPERLAVTVWRATLACQSKDGAVGASIRHGCEPLFEVVAGVRERGTAARGPYIHSFVETPYGSAHIERSPTMIGAYAGNSRSRRHVVSVRDMEGDPHLFAWGNPDVDLRLGCLGVRFTSCASGVRGYADWKERCGVEWAANDSKVAA